MKRSRPSLGFVPVAVFLAAAISFVHAQTPRPRPREGATPPRAPAAVPAAPGTLLLIADAACEVSLDGTPIGPLEAGGVRTVRVALGQHFVRATAGGEQWEEIVDVKNTTQMVLRITLGAAVAKRAEEARVKEEADQRAREEAAAREAEARKTPQQKAQEIALRALEALGGVEAIRNIKTIVTESTNSDKDSSQLFRNWTRLPDTNRTELIDSSGNTTTVIVTADHVTWRKYKTDPTVSEQWEDPSGKLWYGMLLEILSGEEPAALRSANAQDIVLASGDSELVFDSATVLPKKWTSADIEMTWSNYRKAGGLLWPFVQRFSSSLTGVSTTTYHRVEFNTPIDPSLFNKP